MNTKFAENFTALLKVKGVSQSQFAKLYGVKANTVNQWANGKREPTFHDLLCICALLNVDVKELLGFTPRTKKALLRDIIGGNKDFQAEQKDLEKQLFEEGKTVEEVATACEELYNQRYAYYVEVFDFEN